MKLFITEMQIYASQGFVMFLSAVWTLFLTLFFLFDEEKNSS